MTEGATTSASRENRKAIPVNCAPHRGPRGFANLVVERKRDGQIVLNEDAALMTGNPATVPGARERHPMNSPARWARSPLIFLANSPTWGPREE